MHDASTYAMRCMHGAASVANEKHSCHGTTRPQLPSWLQGPYTDRYASTWTSHMWYPNIHLLHRLLFITEQPT